MDYYRDSELSLNGIKISKNKRDERCLDKEIIE